MAMTSPYIPNLTSLPLQLPLLASPNQLINYLGLDSIVPKAQVVPPLDSMLNDVHVHVPLNSDEATAHGDIIANVNLTREDLVELTEDDVDDDMGKRVQVPAPSHVEDAEKGQFLQNEQEY